MATLVLNVFGDDRPGLVDAVAEVIDNHGGSWDKSYMAELGGKFTGIVAVTVADGSAAALSDALAGLADSGLEITVHEASEEEPDTDHREMRFELFGQDHPGIIHDLSHALAQSLVSIVELSTETEPAPMGSGQLFRATATIDVPNSLSAGELRTMLDQLEKSLSVDIDLIDG